MYWLLYSVCNKAMQIKRQKLCVEFWWVAGTSSSKYFPRTLYRTDKENWFLCTFSFHYRKTTYNSYVHNENNDLTLNTITKTRDLTWISAPVLDSSVLTWWSSSVFRNWSTTEKNTVTSMSLLLTAVSSRMQASLLNVPPESLGVSPAVSPLRISSFPHPSARHPSAVLSLLQSDSYQKRSSTDAVALPDLFVLFQAWKKNKTNQVGKYFQDYLVINQ